MDIKNSKIKGVAHAPGQKHQNKAIHQINFSLICILRRSFVDAARATG
jgi:hypothetical protein